MEGFVYILNNKTISGIKIGRTINHPIKRLRELSKATGVPKPFFCEYWAFVPDCITAEKTIHSQFNKNNIGKEFYDCNLLDVYFFIQNSFEIKEDQIYPNLQKEILDFEKNEISKVSIVRKSKIDLAIEKSRRGAEKIIFEILKREKTFKNGIITKNTFNTKTFKDLIYNFIITKDKINKELEKYIDDRYQFYKDIFKENIFNDIDFYTSDKIYQLVREDLDCFQCEFDNLIKKCVEENKGNNNSLPNYPKSLFMSGIDYKPTSWEDYFLQTFILSTVYIKRKIDPAIQEIFQHYKLE